VRQTWLKYSIVELVGTLALIFVGAGTTVAEGAASRFCSLEPERHRIPTETSLLAFRAFGVVPHKVWLPRLDRCPLDRHSGGTAADQHAKDPEMSLLLERCVEVGIDHAVAFIRAPEIEPRI
jgi:hypothetical protein